MRAAHQQVLVKPMGAIIAKTLDAKDLLKNSSNPNFGAKINVGYNSNDGHNYGLSVFGKNDVFD